MIKNLNSLALSLLSRKPEEERGVSTVSWQTLRAFLRGSTLVLSLLLSFSLLVPATSLGNSKHDKFRGTVVNAGPKAITVKSQDNIYRVRTFNYAPELEKKVQNKRPPVGKRVTVRYIRGTETAVSID
jgi:hypothetical protein